MKTRIIISKGWKFVTEYDFLFTMSKGDVIEWLGDEYIVVRCFLEIENETMIILLNNQ